MSPRSARRIAFLGLALAGTLVGHTLTYLLAIRPVALRSEHLARAGHSYWGAAVWIVSAVVACGLLALIISALRRRNAVTEGPGPWRGAAIMILAQVTGFLALEGLERAASGAGFGDLVDHDLLLVGLLVQVVLSLAGAMILRWLVRAARMLAGVRNPSIAGHACLLLAAPPELLAPRPAMPLGGWGLRGPPLSIRS